MSAHPRRHGHPEAFHISPLQAMQALHQRPPTGHAARQNIPGPGCPPGCLNCLLKPRLTRHQREQALRGASGSVTRLPVGSTPATAIVYLPLPQPRSPAGPQPLSISSPISTISQRACYRRAASISKRADWFLVRLREGFDCCSRTWMAGQGFLVS
jgi:hypothetical protein